METKTIIGISILSVFVIAMTSATAMYYDGEEVASQNTFYIVSNTEYWSGETGQVIARFVDFQGLPISVDNCTTDILTPDGSTFFVQDELMTASGITGDHYYQFTVPATEGVYDYSVTCRYSPNKEATSSKTFHVSPALNKIKALDELNVTLQGIEADLEGINTTINNVYTDTQDIRANMVTDTNFQDNMTAIFTELTAIEGKVDEVQAFCDNTETNSSSLCQLIHGINNQVVDTQNYMETTIKLELDEINATTHNTYDLLSGTINTNINTILTNLGILTTTVNQINTTVNNIQTDVTTVLTNQGDMQDNVTEILTNQQDQVALDILS